MRLLIIYMIGMFQDHKSSKGFTMVEFIVVLALFAILMGSTVGIFLSTVQNQRRVLGDQELFNQASFMMEYLSRSMRTAVVDLEGTCMEDDQGVHRYVYLLTHYNEDEGEFYEGVQFLTEDGTCEEIFLDRNDGGLKEIRDGVGAPQLILSSKFKINYVRFVVNGDKTLPGATQDDLVQPRITMLFNITGLNQQPKTFQTTISHININD